MSTYKISNSGINVSPELLQDLEQDFQKFNIDFYLCGAVARNVWMQGVHKLDPAEQRMILYDCRMVQIALGD
jgi:hypothetical protein